MSTNSHKRTNSAAENATEAPETKRHRAQEVLMPVDETALDNRKPQYVYVVKIDSAPQYMDSTSVVHGIYATIEDANNAVKGIANEEYSAAEECSRGVERDGRVFWSSNDAGEGEVVEIRIQVMEVKGPGSEPEREWEEKERVRIDGASVDEEGEEDEDDGSEY